MVADNTPVIIGVGQYSERVGEPGYEALSYMDLAGRALAAAIADSSASEPVSPEIDTLAAIRAFEMSRPDRKPPFGAANNVPRAIAGRVGANPKRAILTTTGGQTNQKLVGEFARDIAAGESQCAVVVGSEAISTVLALSAKGEKPDWSEEVEGDFEDQGFGVEGLLEPSLFAHGATGAIPLYALAENARRAKLCKSLDGYRRDIGELFEPFTKVAAANPHAAAQVKRSAEELATVTERNRIVAEPYTRMTVARDQVNQAAAVIIASAGLARKLGIPEDKWVHIHAVTSATELKLSERPDLSANPASLASVDAALARAGKGIADMQYIDFYSCFAIPVFNQIDHFGLTVDDPRGLTLTGGLPFFGGAGNNYSAHAICEAVQSTRGDRGSFALVGANGGWMSKYAAGVYSTEPADWSANDRYEKLPLADNAVPAGKGDFERATVETYTINNAKKGSVAVWLGRNEAGERVSGNADLSDEPTRAAFDGGEPFGAKLTVRQKNGRNIGRIA
ncbi:acetyl-CoA acetyltransferase [Erythrobacter sp. F6033]|uniref:acetyl-CoA acetyltransferase n=1 Tax=Erythrobacter sp. F6033 TaxID=2926401 RepID=UPI001FF5886A|nr:acetyl-CoA acetyltransferase [Erythrobacter sp. F6033]MCK0129325.1 acetyl-CoA acetyltransferase [Erythrobacter sp. F6033]